MPLIREKVLDVKDLGNRLTRNLLNEESDECDYRGQIIIAHELLPSDILKLSAENVEGFIVSSGVTSHNAIISRSLGIPMVAISREQADNIPDGEEMLMDAEQGIIYLEPGDEKGRRKSATPKFCVSEQVGWGLLWLCILPPRALVNWG